MEEKKIPCDRAEWIRYYSKKRIYQQWMQLHLLSKIEAENILETGPYMGFITSLLMNMDYDVTTNDVFDQQFNHPAVPHIKKDIRELRKNDLEKFDCVIACEIFEHIEWDYVDDVIKNFKSGGVKHIIVSVPYEGLQFFFQLHWTPWSFDKHTAIRKTHLMRRFKKHADPYGHKWEIGFKGYSVKAFARKFEAAGYKIAAREFSYGCKSLFFLASLK